MANKTGTAAGEEILGTATADTLSGLAGNDKLFGLGGDDILIGGADADELDGGDGKDTASYSTSKIAVTVSLLDNSGIGGDAQGDTYASIENLTGSGKDDSLIGNTGANRIDGGAGNDYLDGGEGADELIGGAGIDTANYANSDAGVTINLQTKALGIGGHAAGDKLATIENIVGSDFDDAITGDGAANLIEGGIGADALDGGAGTDTVSYLNSSGGVTINLKTATASGGDADGDSVKNFENVLGSIFADRLTGTTGVNVLTGGAGDDILAGDLGNDTLDGGDGTDTADFSSATAAVTASLLTGKSSGGAGSDKLISIENLTGGGANDLLTGNAGDSVLDGGAGNDTLSGDAGADELIGGDGVDTASYATSNAAVSIDLLAGTYAGGHADGDTLTEIESVIGSKFDDTLVGDAGNNKLDGGNGNDFLEGGEGADELIGGAGIDTASYANSAAGVTVNLTLKTAQVSTGEAAGDKLTTIENLIGSNLDDKLTGDNLANVIIGGAGADTLDGGAGADTASYAGSSAGVTVALSDTAVPVTASGGDAEGDTLVNFEHVTGSAFDDELTGNKLVNNLIGGAGNDILVGGAGNDVLDGGDGIDTASFAGTAAAVTANLATGKVSGGAGSDKLTSIENLTGGNGNDSLTGDAGDNRLDGGNGDDTLIGGAGADELIGGDGSDTVSYAASSVGVSIDLENSTASGGDANGDTFSGIESVIGGLGDDTLIGDGSNNVLTGGNGNDVLVGGAGNDKLDGGAGDDQLDGGEGDDIIIGGTNTAAGDTVSYYSLSGGNGVGVDLSNTKAQNTGGGGTDTITLVENAVGSIYADTLRGTSATNMLSGKEGDDVLIGLGGADTLDGGDDNDTASYSGSSAAITVTLGTGGAQTIGAGGDAAGDKISNIENLVGGKGNDLLTGNELDNVLDGAEGNDTIEGGAGADTLIGGAGINTLSYAGDTTGVTVDLSTKTVSGGDADGDSISDFQNATGGAGDDILTGDTGSNTLLGGAGNDKLTGGAGNDVLDGGNDDDLLDGGDGDDKISGGAGNDTATYASTLAGVSVSLAVTSAQATGGAGKDTLSAIENIIGTAFNDKLTGDKNANRLEGGDGNDTIAGGAGADELIGGMGVDTLDYSASSAGITVTLGTGGSETTGAGGDADGDEISEFENIIGGGGADVLIGNELDNALSGGNGNDLLEGGEGADTLDGGAGIDTATYANSDAGVSITLNNGSLAAAADGGHAAGDIITNVENLVGSGFDDTLAGNGAVNKLEGGDGDDFIDGGLGNDVLDGGTGSDTVSFGSAASAVTANLATGAASGGAGADVISNFENLTGSKFNDKLTGDAGDNTITGGAGNDTLTGNGGTDLFVISAGDGVDTITDFQAGNGGDVLDLSGIPSADSFSAVLAAASQSGSNTVLFFPGGQTITLQNVQVGDLAPANFGFPSSAPTAIDISKDNVDENSADGTVVGTLTTTDSDPGDKFTYTLLDDAGGLFSISGNKIVVSGDLDYESQASYEVEVEVTDLASNTFTQKFTINVNDVNEAPAIVSDGGGATASVSITENTKSVTTVQATDPDAVASLTYSIAGGADSALFAIDGTTGELSFVDAPDYEAGDNSYEVIVRASDGSLKSDQTITVTVEDEDEAPVVTSLVDFEASSGLTAAGQLVAEDPEGAPVTYFISGGVDAGLFQIDENTGEISFINAPDFENPLDDGADNTYDIIVEIQDGTGNFTEQAVTIKVNPPSLIGDENWNTIVGTAGSDLIQGKGGNDTLQGGDGDDTIDGGDGLDFAVYTDATSGISFNLASQTVTGDGVGTDTLIDIEAIRGTNFDDTFDASTFTGSSAMPGVPAGFSSFEGMAGDDTIIGRVDPSGVWLTRASYVNATAAVTIDLLAGTATGDASVGTDTLINIGHVYGSKFGDEIYGTNNLTGSADHLEGRAGDDYIDGRGGFDRATYYNDQATKSGISVNLAAGTVVGDESVGTDTLRSIESIRGTHFADTFDATGFSGFSTNAGNAGTLNEFEGAGGDDLVIGNGNTRLNFQLATAGVTADIAAGTATGNESVGNDTFSGVNTLFGSSFGDKFYGSENPLNTQEVFLGLGGDDFIDGRGGFDVAAYYSPIFTTSAITVDLAAGTVTGDASVGTDTLRSVEGVQGTQFADTFDATGFSDKSTNAGSFPFFNQFEGMQGEDVIIGNGFTRLSYASASGGVSVNLQTGIAIGDGSVGTDTFTGVNSVRGSNFGDHIIGDSANNTIIGQGGDDVFVYADGGGADTLADFIAGGSTQDRIDLSGVTGIFNLADVLALATQSGPNVVIDFGGGNSITLQNVTLGNLHEDDFIFNNAIVGDDDPNELVGTAGNDYIMGLGGKDTLQGGEGDDKLDGGDGVDTAVYSDATAGISFNLASQTVTGDGVGTDTLINIEAIRGTEFDDIYDPTGFNGSSNLPGVGGGFNVFEGMGGNDLIIGLVNEFNQGLTRASYLTATSSVTVDLLAGTATGDASVGNDTLVNVGQASGSAYDDELYGAYNAPYTAEFFEGRAGNDYIDGRGGFDRAMYTNDTDAAAGIIVDMAAGTVTGDGAIGTDTLRGIEGIRGTHFDDKYDATGFSGVSANAGSSGTFNEFEGAGGDDEIIGNGNTRLAYNIADGGVTIDLVAGTASGHASIGNDTFSGVNAVFGSFFDDEMYGSENAANTAETFTGFAGNDYIDGRGGFDIASYYATTYVTSGITVDLASGVVTGDDSIGTDTLRGLEGIQGTHFDDVFVATGFNNLSTNAGFSGGFNQFEGMHGDDSITGNGATRISFSTALEGVNVNLLTGIAVGGGSVGTDTFTGVNSVRGSNFDDYIVGNAVNNVIIGQLGDDTFVYANGGKADTLSDFAVGVGTDDRIDLSGLTGFDDFADVQAVASQSGANILLNFGSGNTITIQNALVGNLHQDDFIF